MSAAHAHDRTAGPPLRVWAAGSLRRALGHAGDQFAREHRVAVEGTYGPSGLLRERLEAGEAADVFFSANMAHPRVLAGQGRCLPVVRGARNRLCFVARPGLALAPETALDVLLQPEVTLGVSTPSADPSGDYAWELFRKAEAVRPGSLDTLADKARRLVGGPRSPAPPARGSVYTALLREGEADVIYTYVSNAVQVRQEWPEAQAVLPPAELAVAADYGLAVLEGAAPAACRFALYLLSPEGQALLAGFGFDPLG